MQDVLHELFKLVWEETAKGEADRKSAWKQDREFALKHCSTSPMNSNMFSRGHDSLFVICLGRGVGCLGSCCLWADNNSRYSKHCSKLW